jgi:hypothetical protein
MIPQAIPVHLWSTDAPTQNFRSMALPPNKGSNIVPIDFGIEEEARLNEPSCIELLFPALYKVGSR